MSTEYLLRDYQDANADKGLQILQKHMLVYYSMEMRTGKTGTAYATAQRFKARKVLCLTTIKAMPGLASDWKNYKDATFDIVFTNYEALKDLPDWDTFDLVIIDEAHKLGAFPLPSERTKLIKEICQGKAIIYCSGTPSPESYSQLFHQFWVSSFGPWKKYKDFYTWADSHVIVEKRTFNGLEVNDYSNTFTATRMDLLERMGKRISKDKKLEIQKTLAQLDKDMQEKIDKIKKETDHLFVTFTQAEAGFKQEIEERFVTIRMKKHTYDLANWLKKNKVYIGKEGQEVVADTAVKLQSKLHQVYSGTVKFEDGNSAAFDHSKVDYILQNHSQDKIAIFYKFKEEEAMLILKFGYDRITRSPEEFNERDDLIFISQFTSGREGTNLSTADYIFALNIDFSATSYWQFRARMQVRDRDKPAVVIWIFAEGGIEEKVYNVVLKEKKNYTLSYFKRDFLTKEDPRSRESDPDGDETFPDQQDDPPFHLGEQDKTPKTAVQMAYEGPAGARKADEGIIAAQKESRIQEGLDGATVIPAEEEFTTSRGAMIQALVNHPILDGPSPRDRILQAMPTGEMAKPFEGYHQPPVFQESTNEVEKVHHRNRTAWLRPDHFEEKALAKLKEPMTALEKMQYIYITKKYERLNLLAEDARKILKGMDPDQAEALIEIAIMQAVKTVNIADASDNTWPVIQEKIIAGVNEWLADELGGKGAPVMKEVFATPTQPPVPHGTPADGRIMDLKKLPDLEW